MSLAHPSTHSCTYTPTHIPTQMSDALKLLNSMLAEGQKPNYFAWESLILAAMDMDAPNTAYLIE